MVVSARVLQGVQACTSLRRIIAGINKPFVSLDLHLSFLTIFSQSPSFLGGLGTSNKSFHYPISTHQVLNNGIRVVQARHGKLEAVTIEVHSYLQQIPKATINRFCKTFWCKNHGCSCKIHTLWTSKHRDYLLFNSYPSFSPLNLQIQIAITINHTLFTKKKNLIDKSCIIYYFIPLSKILVSSFSFQSPNYNRKNHFPHTCNTPFCIPHD